MGTLLDRLQNVGYRLTERLENQVQAALNTRPCAGSFLSGPAGTGKTFLAESVAQVEEREAFFFQAFPGCRKEELYQTILPDAGQPSGFRTVDGILPQAASASHDRPTALILDEWDKTHPSTDAFLLDFLQSGRISVPGCQVRAHQDNLIVFVTLNDERELSEPLLRRLPMIELAPAPAEVVADALGDTHAGHPYLGSAVTLYRRSLLVHLSKPVTIQELRQLMDAITHLGSKADWNQLVFQFCTKNWDDHELLKSAEGLPVGGRLDYLERERPELDPGQYDAIEHQPRAAGGEGTAMPRVRRDWMDETPARPVEADGTRHFGIVPRSEPGYDSVARAALSRGDETPPISDPSDLDIAQVGETEIVVFKPLYLERIEEWGLVLKNGGELLLEARHRGEITQSMMRGFQAGTALQARDDPERCLIYSVTAGEMLMRYRKVKIRWTPQIMEVVTGEFEPTKELWEFLYGTGGVITAQRRSVESTPRQASADEASSNEQMRADYLKILKDDKHLRAWFDLLITRNLRVWGQITCEYEGYKVVGSVLPTAEFNPDSEHPDSKEEADAIAIFVDTNHASANYLDAHRRQIESELTLFVAKRGELPPAVEEGRIFSWQRTGLNPDKTKREGLKLYMRKGVQEA
ncbi:MAG: AAA family ATPase [SAR324 cluster bacterium]|nr:AAA family ATPase [SAR324 cluster bacterium]